MIISGNPHQNSIPFVVDLVGVVQTRFISTRLSNQQYARQPHVVYAIPSEFSMPPDFLRRRDCIGFPGNEINLNAFTNIRAYFVEKKGKITNDWKNRPKI